MDAPKDTQTFTRLMHWPQYRSILLLTVLLNFMGVGGALAEEPAVAVDFPVKLPEMDFSKIKPLAERSGVASSFVEEQLRQRRLELENAEGRLKSFKHTNRLISLTDQRRLLLAQRQSLDTSLKSAENRARGLEQKLLWLKDQLSQVTERIPLSSVNKQHALVNHAKTNLLNLELEEQELLSKYHTSHRRVAGVQKEIEILKTFLKGQEAVEDNTVTTGKNPLYQSIEMDMIQTEAELVSVTAQSGVIQQQINQVNQDLTRLNGLENELESLRRDVEASERNYLDYLTKVGTTPGRDYKIQVGDRLDIKFFFNPELNEQVWVRPDGRIALQLVGEISVAGNTVEELRKTLIQGYAKQLKNPEIAIILQSNSAPLEAARKVRDNNDRDNE